MSALIKKFVCALLINQNHFRSTLPSLFHGIGSLLNLTLNESVKRYLRELFTIFSHRFECNEMHPVAKVFQSSKTEMIRVQIAFYQYFYEVVFPETKRVKAKRPNLVNLINLVRTGFLGRLVRIIYV